MGNLIDIIYMYSMMSQVKLFAYELKLNVLKSYKKPFKEIILSLTDLCNAVKTLGDKIVDKVLCQRELIPT